MTLDLSPLGDMRGEGGVGIPRDVLVQRAIILLLDAGATWPDVADALNVTEMEAREFYEG